MSEISTVSEAAHAYSAPFGPDEGAPRKPGTRGMPEGTGSRTLLRSGVVAAIRLYQLARSGRPSPCRYVPTVGVCRRGRAAPRGREGWGAGPRRITPLSAMGRSGSTRAPGRFTMNVIPMFGSTIGKIFEPLFEVMAWLIAFFYTLVPNYAIAIALLTVVVMVVTAPLTVKSTRSMVSMQRLAPS